MANFKRFHGAQLPVLLTLFLIVGTAWSWVSQQPIEKPFEQETTSQEIQTSLVEFALEANEDSDPASLPSCCSAKTEQTAVATSEKPSCCAGSASSKAVVADSDPIDAETAAMIATVKIPQQED